MNSVLVKNAFSLYKEHLRLSLLFGTLLVFIAFFSLFSNIVFSSGSFFWEYSFFYEGLLVIAEFLGLLLFLAFYSFFVSAVIFIVRKELSKVRVEYYLSEMIKKFAFRLFTFFTLFIFGLIILGSFLTWIGVHVLIINFIFLVLSILFLFVPQAIVIDEVKIRYAVQDSYEFILRNKGITFLILVLGSAFLAVILLLEYVLDMLSIGLYVGRIVSFCIVLMFVIPFFEMLKTYSYMLKFGLVKGGESVKHLKIE